MAYNVRFRFVWRSTNDNIYKIEILQNGYSGSVVQRPLGGAPQLRRNKSGAICGTSLEFLAQAQVDGEFAVLYTSNPQAFRVDLYQGSTLIWQGFITPELYSEPYIAPPYNVRVTATDNLGELKLSDYTAQGRVTIASLLSYFLGKTGLSLPVHWLNAMHPSSGTSVAAENMPTSTTVNLDYMEGKTCYDVLAKMLDTFHAIIVQHGCQWLVVRETDLEYLRSGDTILALDGSTFAIGDFGSMLNRTWWPIGHLSQSVVPAKKKKVITAPNNWIENLLPKTATSSTNATYNAPSDGDTPYYELVPWNGSQQYSQASIAFWSPFSEFVPVKDLNLSLVIQTFGVLAGHTYGKKCAAITVKVVGSDGSSYINCYLGEDGNLTTSMVEAMPIYGVGQDAPEEHNLVIPVASQMATMGYTKVYQIQVGITTTDAEDAITRMRLYGWTCNVPEQNKGYQVTCILNNGARGEDAETEIAAADNTNKNLESVFVTNGFKYTASLGGASIAQWASGNISSMALLEFLARDYSLGIAVPRLRMEGIINVPKNTTLPLLFRGGGSSISNSIIFWPEKWDWNLVDDSLDVSMVSLPAASVQVTSVTRTAQGSDGMVISSGGSAPSDGGGGGTGTMTSVGVAMPTGFTVSGSPITTAGIISIAFAEGYALPLTVDVQKGVTAFGWGDHSQAGYLTGITSAMITTALGFTPTANTGTVTSIKVTTPTGLRVSNGTSQTITGSGTFAIQLQSGYSIPTTDKQSSWDAGVTSANAAFAAAVTNRVDDASGIVDGSYNLVTANAIYDKFNGSVAFMPVASRTSNYAKIADNATGDTYLITAGAVAKYVAANRTLNDLTDVQVNGPDNNDFFVYSSSLSKWTNISNSNVLQALIGSNAIGGQQNGSGMYRPIYWGGASFLPIPAGSVASGNNYPVSGNEVYTHFLNTAANMSVDTTSVTSSQSKVPTSYAVLQYVNKITDASTSTWENNTGCLTGAAMYGFLQESALMPVSKYADTTALPTAAANDGYFNIPSETGSGNPGDNHLATCSLIYKYLHKHWWSAKDATINTAAACSLETASSAASSYGSDNVIMTQKAVNYKLRNYVTGSVSTSADDIMRGDRVIVMADDLIGALQDWGLIN